MANSRTCCMSKLREIQDERNYWDLREFRNLENTEHTPNWLFTVANVTILVLRRDVYLSFLFYSILCVKSFPYPKLEQTQTHSIVSMSLLPSKLNIPLHLHILHPPNPNPGLPYPIPRLPYPRSQTPRFLCAKRTGKQRYPSEKKKLKQKHKETLLHVDNKFEGIWRLSKLGVPLHNDPGKDSLVISQGLLQEIAKVLEFPVILHFLGCQTGLINNLWYYILPQFMLNLSS